MFALHSQTPPPQAPAEQRCCRCQSPPQGGCTQRPPPGPPTAPGFCPRSRAALWAGWISSACLLRPPRSLPLSPSVPIPSFFYSPSRCGAPERSSILCPSGRKICRGRLPPAPAGIPNRPSGRPEHDRLQGNRPSVHNAGCHFPTPPAARYEMFRCPRG